MTNLDAFDLATKRIRDDFDLATIRIRDSILIVMIQLAERQDALTASHQQTEAKERKLADDRAAMEADRLKFEDQAKGLKGISQEAARRLAEIKELRKCQEQHLQKITRLEEENKSFRRAILALGGKSEETPETRRAVKTPVAAPVS